MKKKRKKTKEAIISAAMQLLCTMDYEQITVRAIAEKANVTPSNIYKYFENKDELVAGLYGHIVEEMINNLNSSVRGVRDTRPKYTRLLLFI